MITFEEFLIQKEYNTTGEVDGRNNTDLGSPSDKNRWYVNKKRCGIGRLPCSKYVANMKKT